jgi:hypothetical protein
MRTSARLALSVAAAALLLCSLVAGSSARSFSLSNRNIRAVFPELVFESKAMQEHPLEPIRCRVTMEGSFQRSTFAKMLESEIGVITRAEVAHPCEVGGREYFLFNGIETFLRARPETSLPWAITYQGFRGILPRINTLNVNITGIIMAVNYGLFLCLETYGKETESRPWVFNIESATGLVTSLEPASGHLLRRQAMMSETCAALARFSRPSSPVTLLGTTSQIAVTLI